MIAAGREHPPHLVVAAFVQHEPHASFVEHRQLRRQQRFRLGFQQQRAAGEHGRFVAAQRLRQCRFVNFWQLGFRRDDPVQQRAVVGEQQQSAGLAIEATRRRQPVSYTHLDVDKRQGSARCAGRS